MTKQFKENHDVSPSTSRPPAGPREILAEKNNKLENTQRTVRQLFRGALVTWECFSSEFTPGGLIDMATAEEKHLAWMPATNDVNEGALGLYQVTVRNKCSMMLHQYNAQAMFQHNDTQDFMDVVFKEADHISIMHQARILDASGIEGKRRKEIVDFRVEVAQIRKEKEDAHKAKNKANAERWLKVDIVTDIADLSGMTVAMLGDQIDAIRFRGLSDVPPKSRFPRKGECQEALHEILPRYHAFLEVHGEVVSVLSSEPGIPVINDWVAEEEAEMDEE